MRISDPVENPILSLTTAWFGGGKKGPSKQEQEAAQQQQADMQAAAQRQAAMMQKQFDLQKQQFDDQKKRQDDMIKQMDANKPAPAAQVVAGDPEGDIRRQAAQRRGMRRSILAGESSQAPMATGSSTLG